MKSIVTTACLLVGACTVHANEISGFHLGVGAGQIKITDSEFGYSATDTGLKGFVGYRFNRSVALEAAYIDGGEPDGIAVSGATAAFLGSLPIGGNAALYAKAGALHWQAEGVYAIRIGNILRYFPYSETGTDFMWGAGLQANAGRFGFRAEYERSEVNAVKYELISGSLFFMF